MMSMTADAPRTAASPSCGTQFTITRLFAAPRERVWAAWIDPALITRWFGPKGVTTAIVSADVRPGGHLHARMAPPSGAPFWFRFDYDEITAPSRLVWIQSFADQAGAIAPSPFDGPWPLRKRTEIAFEEEGGATRVTLVWTPLDANPDEIAAFIEEMAGMETGWGASFDKLDEVLGEG
jgi:uncharacterized protein YndB with AHSA1/START domain